MNNHNHPVRAELQSLDQRRADTLADALRPVALTDDTPTPETWRVVEPDGSVNMLRVQDIGGGVYIIRCDSLGREHVRAASSRCAVERFAGQYLGAAEIRGPGEFMGARQSGVLLSESFDGAWHVGHEADGSFGPGTLPGTVLRVDGPPVEALKHVGLI